MYTLPTEKKYAPKMERTSGDIAADIGRAVAQGATLGFSDEIYGLYSMFMTDKTYDEAVAEVREGLERFRQTDPAKAYGFEILGGMLTGGGAAVGAARAGIGAGLRGAAALGAAEGAAYGAGTGETLGERVTGAAMGAPIGAVGGVVGEAITPRVTGAAKSLMERGFPLTPGQAFGGTVKSLEEKMSLPFAREMIQQAQQRPVQQFRRETVEGAIKGLEVEIPKGLDGEDLVEFAEDAIGEAYENIVPKLSIDVSPVQDSVNRIVRQRVADGAFSEADAGDFGKLISEVFTRNIRDGKLSRQMLKDTESDMSSEIRSLFKGSMQDRRMGRALKEVQDAMRDEITKQNPGVPALQTVNRAFAKMRPIVSAKDKALARGGEFQPTQLLRAQKQARVPRTAPEVEAARQARDVLGGTTGTSFTAERFLASSPIGIGLGAAVSPVVAGMYGTGLGRGAARGILQAPGRALRLASPVGGGLLAEDYMTVAP